MKTTACSLSSPNGLNTASALVVSLTFLDTERADLVAAETDILAAREAQSERPMAKYDVLTAAAFIKNGATTSELSSIFAAPTEADLESATEPAPLFMPLEHTLSEALDQLEEGKPFKPAEPLTAASVPSIPTLLDRLSREMSELFESSLQNFAASVEKQDGIVLGNVSAAHLRARPVSPRRDQWPSKSRLMQREQDEGGCLYFAFTHKAPGNSPLLRKLFSPASCSPRADLYLASVDLPHRRDPVRSHPSVPLFRRHHDRAH